MLDAHYLVLPGRRDRPRTLLRRPDEQGRILRGPRLASSATGRRRTERLERLIFDWLDRTVTGRRPVHEHLPADRGTGSTPPDDATTTRSSSTQASDEGEISDTRGRLRWSGFVSWSVLEVAPREPARPSRSPSAPSISSATARASRGSRRPGRSEMARAFHHFGGCPIRPDDGLRRPGPRGRPCWPGSSRTSTPRATGGTTSSRRRSRRTSPSASRWPR